MAKTVSDLTHTGQVNSFTGGLNTDLHPLVQPNDTLTDCINGTLITYNGNENMLQNDVGNYALEGSALPDGFIPLGLKEHNGVVYIVSQNSMTKEVQIGSYPSPHIISTEKQPQKLDSDPIKIHFPNTKDYSYDNLFKSGCIESNIVSETSYTEFDVELNFGDEYAISPMDGNIDFQYEQFAIQEESGKITNINPIIDGEMHVVNWISSGQLLKKYILNKVVNFTQDISWSVLDSNKKSRIVNGVTTDSYIYPDEDFQSITVKNTVEFDRIDVVREPNDELLVGVVHKIITGNPKAYCLDLQNGTTDWRKVYKKTHNILVTTDAATDGTTKYEFVSTLSRDDVDAAGFMYFLRTWGIINKTIFGTYLDSIEIQSYPILIHRVNGKDKSVLLYDESGKRTSISELDVKGDFVYQYYCESADDLTKVCIKLDGLDTNKEFKANILYLQESGSLLTPNEAGDNIPSHLIFEYNSENKYWEGLVKTTDSVLFFEANILNSHYVFPLFTSVDFTAYEQFSSLYNNFCLIPGDKLLDISTSGKNIEIGNTKTSKYVKLTDKLKLYDEPFYTSVYYPDNGGTYYGDVECGDITINNYFGNKATLELQKQNTDGSWTTISQKTAQVTNGTATFKDCIVSANIQKAIEGDFVDKCLERVYLAEIGHAPFAHSEDANTRNKDDWKKRFCDNIEFSNDKSKKEKLFEKLKVKYEWDKRKSLYVGKHCGKHNNEFVVNTCDIYGNVDVENSPRTHATTEGWKKEFNSEQLFVPVTFNVNCKTALLSRWEYFNLPGSYMEDDDSRVRELHKLSYTTTLGNTVDIPLLTSHSSLAFTSWTDSPKYYDFDKWLLYLYTHVFYYKESQVSAGSFSLIKPNINPLKIRYLIKGVFNKSLNIAGIDFTQQAKNTLLSQLKLNCKNFDFISSIDENPEYKINYYEHNKQWNEITSIVNSFKQENNISYNTLYCDVFTDNWTVCKWGNSSTDENYTNVYKIIGDISNGSIVANDASKLEVIYTCGNKSSHVTLAQMLGTKTSFNGGMNIQHTVYSELPNSYDFSPRFKQIINYGTDD